MPDPDNNATQGNNRLLVVAPSLFALCVAVVASVFVIWPPYTRQAANTQITPVAPTASDDASTPAAESGPVASAPPAAEPAQPEAHVTAATSETDDGGDTTASEARSTVAFVPPGDTEIPEGPMGDVIRRGEQIFLHTGANAKAFVGNTLNCVSCHLDAGRLADSAPMWGAYPKYPAYRSKTKSVSTFAERLRGCFMYSMNGKAPPDGHEVLVALESYAYWMATGAPTGKDLPGAGYPALPEPEQAPDVARGEQAYQANCALCHGTDGQGQRSGDTQVFPALWGEQSYNWGAGMHRINTAAAFIKANMPLGLAGSLSDQEAWDVAAYIDSHERPQDPRFTGDVQETRAQFHDNKYSLYGTTVNGVLLGSGPLH